MAKRRFFQSFLVAGALLGAAGTAHAVPTGPIQANTSTFYVYSTSSSLPEAPGTMQYSGAVNALGGLCANETGACGNVNLPLGNSNDTYGSLISGGETTAGVIAVDTPSAVGNYLLTFSLKNITIGVGDIYEVVVNGNDLGTTSVVAYNQSGSSGTFSVLLKGGGSNTAIDISVTDLLQQYLGTANQGLPYDLPSQLGGPTSDDDPSGLALSFDPQSQFVLSGVQLTLAPEPATLSICALGSLALGAARRRHQRGKLVKAAA